MSGGGNVVQRGGMSAKPVEDADQVTECLSNSARVCLLAHTCALCFPEETEKCV